MNSVSCVPLAQFLYALMLDNGTTPGVPHAPAAAMELLRAATLQDDRDARRLLEEKQHLLAGGRPKKTKSRPTSGNSSQLAVQSPPRVMDTSDAPTLPEALTASGALSYCDVQICGPYGAAMVLASVMPYV